MANAALYVLESTSFGTQTRWNIAVAPAWLASGASNQVTLPDLSAVTGFKASWGHPTGAVISWSVLVSLARNLISATSYEDDSASTSGSIN